MKWVYDLCGAEPIIKDECVYDAAAIAQGEMLMLSTGDFTVGTAGGAVAVSAYASTVAEAHATNAVGVTLEAKDTDDTPSVATVNDTTAEPCYVKTIINPLAVYRAEILSTNGATSGSTAVAAWTDASDFQVAYTATAAESMTSKFWVYCSNTAGPNFGELRFVLSAATADSFGVDTAPAATSTTADRAICIPAKLQLSLGLANDAVNLSTGSVVAKITQADNLRIVETLMDADGGFEIMHQHTHKGRNVKKAGKAAKFYNDIVCLDHAYGSNPVDAA